MVGGCGGKDMEEGDVANNSNDDGAIFNQPHHLPFFSVVDIVVIF